jgi:hypothetical protein
LGLKPKGFYPVAELLAELCRKYPGGHSAQKLGRTDLKQGISSDQGLSVLGLRELVDKFCRAKCWPAKVLFAARFVPNDAYSSSCCALRSAMMGNYDILTKGKQVPGFL